MRTKLWAAWRGMDLFVLRNGTEVDRVHADEIRRVVLVNGGAGETPGDLSFALIETDSDYLLLPASSGIAGCVHFEHQAFWSQRDCIYWVNAQNIELPRKLRSGLWPLRRPQPADFMRLPRAELDTYIQKWPLEGPQTWEQRKWKRITRSRSLSPLDQAAAGAPVGGERTSPE